MRAFILLKRRCFTLLEVLISLALTTLLLSILLAAYFQAEKASAEGERMRAGLWPRRMLAERLNALFSTLEKPDTKQKVFFYSSQDNSSLLFTYNNGVSLSPSFSGEVLSELFLNKKGEITLLTWPARSTWNEEMPPNPKREVLLKDVEDLNFEFFQVGTDKETAQWVYSWDKAKNALPGMVRIRFKKSKNQEDETITLLIPQVIGVIKS